MIVYALLHIIRQEVFILSTPEIDKRLGVVGIVIDDLSAAEDVNSILHDFSSIIIGRMGIPYRERGVSVISITVDGSMDEISALTGRLGRVKHISVKAALTKDIR